jgi:sulfopyruvate decarboxylase alpha subunit
MTDDGPQWAHDLYDYLVSEDVRIFCYVPDAGHSVLIDRSLADPDSESISLTTEEEGVALCAGAHLGGRKAVLLMQSSGLGNCVNMFSLLQTGMFPFLTFLSMRGDFGEGNPWQMPMGQAAEAVLEAMGFQCLPANRPEEVGECARAGLTMAYKSNVPVAVLLTQRLLGAKAF